MEFNKILKQTCIGASILAGLNGLVYAQAACEGRTEPVKFAGITWESGQFYTEIIRIFAKDGFGCATEVVNGSTAATESALVSGNLQVWAEQWNRTDIIKKGQELGKITLVGNLLAGGAYEGWFVPTYVVKGDPKRNIKAAAPDLTSVADLPKFKSLFKDDEDPSKGRLLSCPVGWDCEVINAQKLKAYNLTQDYNGFRPGTGAALDAAISSALERGKPILFYYWSPAALMGKYSFYQLKEPAYNAKCFETERNNKDKNPCPSATPNTPLNVGVATSLLKSNPELIKVIEKVQLNPDQVNAAVLRMAEKKVRADVVARDFLKNNPEVWKAWADPAIIAKVKTAVSK